MHATHADVEQQPITVKVSPLHSLMTTLIWLVIWGAPMLALFVFEGEGLLLEIGVYSFPSWR